MEEKAEPSCSSSDRPKRRKTPNSKYFGDSMVSSQKQNRKRDTEKTEVKITHKTRQITDSSDENESIVFVGDTNVEKDDSFDKNAL